MFSWDLDWIHHHKNIILFIKLILHCWMPDYETREAICWMNGPFLSLRINFKQNKWEMAYYMLRINIKQRETISWINDFILLRMNFKTSKFNEEWILFIYRERISDKGRQSDKGGVFCLLRMNNKHWMIAFNLCRPLARVMEPTWPGYTLRMKIGLLPTWQLV